MRIYSPEWVAAFNAAAAATAPATEDAEDFALLQVVEGAPEGTIRIGLSSVDGTVAMTLDPPDAPAPQVTLAIGYDDAVALSQGRIDPAQLVAQGRVKVRGDLSVLVGGQALLAAVAARVAAPAG